MGKLIVCGVLDDEILKKIVDILINKENGVEGEAVP